MQLRLLQERLITYYTVFIEIFSVIVVKQTLKMPDPFLP